MRWSLVALTLLGGVTNAGAQQGEGAQQGDEPGPAGFGEVCLRDADNAVALGDVLILTVRQGPYANQHIKLTQAGLLLMYSGAEAPNNWTFPNVLGEAVPVGMRLLWESADRMQCWTDSEQEQNLIVTWTDADAAKTLTARLRVDGDRIKVGLQYSPCESWARGDGEVRLGLRRQGLPQPMYFDDDGKLDCSTWENEKVFYIQESDRDADGHADGDDNCQCKHNDQHDQDGDSYGDVCDLDADGDLLRDYEPYEPEGDHPRARPADWARECGDDVGVRLDLGELDLCPRVQNNGKNADVDQDGVGDVCDDSDGDGVLDHEDNCVQRPNEGQADLDEDGVGDVCDPDLDGDGKPNEIDNCPRVKNWDQAPVPPTIPCRATGLVVTIGAAPGRACVADFDNDRLLNKDDNCPTVCNRAQEDLDGDGVGDACDDDDDGDGVSDAIDNCPRVSNTEQRDLDGDGEGDDCDPDDDGDRVIDVVDNCKAKRNADQRDTDADGIGDLCDKDIDGDNVANTRDRCPFSRAHTNFPDCQNDLDGDGIPNEEDPCRLVPDLARDPRDDSGRNACDVDDDDDDIEDICDVDCQFGGDPKRFRPGRLQPLNPRSGYHPAPVPRQHDDPCYIGRAATARAIDGDAFMTVCQTWKQWRKPIPGRLPDPAPPATEHHHPRESGRGASIPAASKATSSKKEHRAGKRKEPPAKGEKPPAKRKKTSVEQKPTTSHEGR